MTNEPRPELSREERFSRIELLLGRAACERLSQTAVMVAGLGAVGSYATEGLARAGIGRLWLIDFDRLTPSNINRHLHALGSTMGRAKCEVARERVLEINPECRVQAIQGFVGPETVQEYLAEEPDLVIDAIDSLNPKVELIAACRLSGIPLICCLGAALRLDPTLVRIGTLDEVKNCHLARAVRKRLRRRNIPLDFPCVYSLEPLPHPLPIAAPTDPLGEAPALDRGRTRHTLGSLPTLPGIFGLTAANLALHLLLER